MKKMKHATPLTLKAVLVKKGITCEQVGELTHYSPRTILAWCQGYRQPSITTLIALCRVLGVTPNDLLDVNYDQ